MGFLKNKGIEIKKDEFLNMAANGIGVLITLAAGSTTPSIAIAGIVFGMLTPAFIKSIKLKKDKTPIEKYVLAFNDVVNDCVNTHFSEYDTEAVREILFEIQSDFDMPDDEEASVLKIKNTLKEAGVEKDDESIKKFLQDVTSKMCGKIVEDTDLSIFVINERTEDVKLIVESIQENLQVQYGQFMAIAGKIAADSEENLKVSEKSLEISTSTNSKLNEMSLKSEQTRESFLKYFKDIKSGIENLVTKEDLDKSLNKSEERIIKAFEKEIGSKNIILPYTKPVDYNALFKEKFKTFKEDYAKKWKEVLFLHRGTDETKTLENTYLLHDYTCISASSNKVVKKSSEKNGTSDKLEDFISKEIDTHESTNSILVTGAPGAGKTSMVAYLASKYIDDDNVIIINFGQLNAYFKDIPELSIVSIERAICSLFIGNDNIDFIQSELSNYFEGKTVILDAFDEFIAADKEQEYLKMFLDDITRNRKNTLVIVTSRDNYVKESAVKLGFTDLYKYKLNEFSNSQIELYYEKITGKSLSLRGKKINREVFGIPVILYMALSIPKPIDITEKKSKLEVYDIIFGEEGGIFSKFKGVAENREGYSRQTPENVMDVEDIQALLRLFEHLAFKIFENKEAAIPEEIYDELKNYIPDGKGGVYTFKNNKKAEDFPIKSIYEGEKNIEFVHKSIYEYFMARRMIAELKSIYDVKENELSTEEFYKRISALLSKGELVRSNELEIMVFFEGMLKKEYYSNKDKNFGVNLRNIDFLKDSFEEMINNGLSDYVYYEVIGNNKKSADNSETIGRNSVDNNGSITAANIKYDCYEKNPQTEFWERVEQERRCFKNLLELIYQIRQVAVTIRDKFPNDNKNISDKFLYYLRSNHYQGLKLTGFNLSDMDMSGINMTGYDLQYAYMNNTKFIGSTLNFADFKESYIKKCDFTRSRLGNVSNLSKYVDDRDGNNFDGADDTPVIGETHLFGHYPQNADGNDNTEILWRVLKVKDGYALLLSDKILDVRPYHTEHKNISWEGCYLNQWLQSDFLNKIFSEAEQVSVIGPDDLPFKDAEGQNDACGKVFLLSEEEIEINFFLDGRDMELMRRLYIDCKHYVIPLGGNTEYAYKGNCLIYSSTQYEKQIYDFEMDYLYNNWWLRSTCSDDGSAFFVTNNGVVNTYGSRVNDASIGVRPALWLNLKSLI